MFAYILFLLTFTLSVVAQIPTPPPLSASDPVTGSGSLSLSSTPSSSLNATTSTSATSTSSTQFPSLGGLSMCANNCLTLAVSQGGCSSIALVDCYCSKANSTRFAQGLVACISSQCPTDLSTAESVAEQFCAIASTSLSFPMSLPSTTFSNPFSSTSTSLSSANTSSSSSSAPAPTSSGSGSGQGNGAAPGLSDVRAVGGVLGIGGALLLAL